VKIYTKTGDKGLTSLFGGKRVAKNTPRIEAYGTVDELNSHLGFARSLGPSPELDAILLKIQHQLFTLGADLATPKGKKNDRVKRIQQTDVVALEETIDEIQMRLEPLKAFILPGGSQVGAQLHVARTVCRRAERLVATLTCKKDASVHVLIYLNRLSDLFFVLARRVNALSKATETQWQGE
jgi:cob(I)alamin adenosyltransferase